ncbi:hypothetical protein RF11_13570 [Thelohanellus kitauei]|uniref:Uncharacterized protein n=1 Tax=Thelohanellus kitauei TaxID=669202 RepID=A0A0C2N073_THEKT|nr:hypothetical protein RF11_13570 [Thelohanellus kitauei]
MYAIPFYMTMRVDITYKDRINDTHYRRWSEQIKYSTMNLLVLKRSKILWIQEFEITLSVGPHTNFFAKFLFFVLTIESDMIHHITDLFRVSQLFIFFSERVSTYRSRKLAVRYLPKLMHSKPYSKSVTVYFRVYDPFDTLRNNSLFEIELTGWRFRCPIRFPKNFVKPYIIYDESFETDTTAGRGPPRQRKNVTCDYQAAEALVFNNLARHGG